MDEIIRTERGDFPALVEGPAGGPVVVLQHGFPDVPHTFAPAMKLLAAAGCRAVAPWMRGYAPAPMAGPHDVDALAADAAALARALAPAGRVTLVGHDWGAVGAYAAAARYPERFAGLVTVSVPHPLAFVRSLGRRPGQLVRSWYMLALQPPGAGEWLLSRGDFALVDRLWAAWSPGLRGTGEHRARVKACLRASGGAPIAYYRSLVRPARAALGRLRDPALRAIGVPTLHLTGADDGCVGPGVGRGQERHFTAGFRSEVIDQAGHFLPLERPTLLAARTLDQMAATGALPPEARPTRRPGAAGPGRGSG